MLTHAVLVPDTALLVPGAAGRAHVLGTLRRHALAAVGDLCAAGAERVVVVHSGPRVPTPAGTDEGPAAAGRSGLLAGAGIDDHHVDWPPPRVALGGAGPVAVALGVAAHLLGRCGWSGPVEEVACGDLDGPGLRAVGRRVADGRPTGLLLVGSLSARRGPDAPLPEHPEADAADRALVSDLVAVGDQARTRLAATPRSRAAELSVSAWGPCQVLLGAFGDGAWRGEVSVHEAPYGAGYAVLTWRRDP